MLKEILDLLNQRLPDHPDVKALLLTKDAPAKQNFFFPPLLYKGLRRVKQHGGLFESTIPPSSLTCLITQSVLMDTPWVTWRKLSANNIEEVQTENSIEPPNLLKKKIIFPSNTVDLKDVISPKAPIFNLSKEPYSFSTLKEASMINAMNEITKNNFYQGMPNVINTNYKGSLFDTLRASDTNKIASATNLPLSRVNAGIAGIINNPSQLNDESINPASEIRFNNEEQLIIKYALQESNLNSHFEQLDRPIVKDFSIGYPSGGDINNTIEDCFSTIRTEANRILMGSKTKSDFYIRESNKIADALKEISNELLRRSDFIATTNCDGKIIYVNGAFIQLAQITVGDTNSKSPDRNKYFLEWEKKLQDLPLGKSILETPAHNLFQKWDVKRSELREENQERLTCFVNVLRGEHASVLDSQQLQKVADVVSTLELFAPLWALDSAESINDYMSQLDTIVQELKHLLPS